MIEIAWRINDKSDTKLFEATPRHEARGDAHYAAMKERAGATEVWKKRGASRPLGVEWHEARENDDMPWAMQQDDSRGKAKP